MQNGAVGARKDVNLFKKSNISIYSRFFGEIKPPECSLFGTVAPCRVGRRTDHVRALAVAPTVSGASFIIAGCACIGRYGKRPYTGGSATARTCGAAAYLFLSQPPGDYSVILGIFPGGATASPRGSVRKRQVRDQTIRKSLLPLVKIIRVHEQGSSDGHNA